MTDKQPEALRLADALENDLVGYDGMSIPRTCQDIADKAAAELRRLYTENADFRATCDHLTRENAEQIGEIVALKERRDELLAVLRMARESIGNSLQSLIETETHPVTGMVEHEGALLVIESEQDLLNQIDSAIAKAGGAA